jgi:hypothetical protein
MIASDDPTTTRNGWRLSTVEAEISIRVQKICDDGKPPA